MARKLLVADARRRKTVYGRDPIRYGQLPAGRHLRKEDRQRCAQ